MEQVLKINCLFNLSMMFASLYFLARARFKHEIRKYIHHKMWLVSIIAGIIGIISWYSFYYCFRTLLLYNASKFNHSIPTLFLFQTVINIPINLFLWYIFLKFKKTKK